MSYNNYATRLTVHECMPWYNVRELMTTLRAILKINFSIVEQRQQALLQLNNLNDEAPFTMNRCFQNVVHIYL